MKKTLDWIARIGASLLCFGSIVFFTTHQIVKHTSLLDSETSGFIFKASLSLVLIGLALAFTALRKLGYKSQL